MRKCSCCQITKSIDDFSRDSYDTTGRRRICKMCDSKKRVRRYKKNPATRYSKRHKSKLTETFTKEQWEVSLAHFNYSCAYCGCTTNLTKDHIQALNSYGTNQANNIIPACKSCNSSKQDKDLETWFLDKFRIHQLDKLVNIYNYRDNLIKSAEK